ncbi:DUF2213 domain-containing protein [Marinobacter segnicrescens]|uniref:DUF2213 domain-containing protein n=1 Tax=Marinobacter segnicrescens TaxID=430453 RepID=UPI003A900356
MTAMQIKDSLTFDASGISRAADGYLVTTGKIARAGNVQQYLGRELGLTGDDAGRMFGVYRDPEVVFDESSMASLAGRPVTRNHPPEGVNAQTWKDLAVGTVGGRIVRDGEHIVASMAIMDAAAAAEVEAGARGLSAGYTTGITADSGVSPSGEPYQYRQSGPIRFNHVAYLPDNNPRAGDTRMGDAHNWGLAPSQAMSETKEDKMSDALKTVVLGDAAVNVTAADAVTVEKFKEAAKAAMTDAQAAHDKALAAKDADLAKKDAEIADLKAKVLDDAAIDARVAARADLVGKAKALVADVATAGKSDADIRKAVVVAKRGAAMADKSPAYIDAAFDLLTEDAETDAPDPVRTALGDAKSNTALNDAKQQTYVARMTRRETA